ncbi:5416_t:CDS:2, partial [Cetraspora pellucida]
DYDGNKNDDNDLFEEFEYESEDLEEVENYFTNSILVGEMSESKKPLDRKPSVKDQLVRIVDNVNIEAQYKVNVEQLF